MEVSTNDAQLISDNYEAWQEGIEFRPHQGVEVETDAALGIDVDGEMLWLPKSQTCAYVAGGQLRVYVPRWLAASNREQFASIYRQQNAKA